MIRKMEQKIDNEKLSIVIDITIGIELKSMY